MKKATLEENGRTRLSSSLSLNWSLNVKMAPWCISHFWRLTSSLRLNWRLNATFSFSSAFMILAFKLQFKLKLELKRH
ncbi:uncharacterized protein DS421_11g334660 [Arachis hypogaea]|nr:uncharacterized protein DS421_11g334660 [Arachis hypogaea]